MTTLGKFIISWLLIVYSLVGFSILSPLLSTLTGNPIFLTIGLAFSLFFVLITLSASRAIPVQWKGIFSLLKDEEATKTWLLLHSFFTFTIGRVYPIFALISSMAPMFLDTSVSDFAMTFMFAWMILFFCILGLWFLHLIVGIGYQWFCKGTAIGIRSFSSLALQCLKNKKHKGFTHLLKAFLMLKDCFKHEKLELQTLNNAIRTIRCLVQFESTVPYNSLQTLAMELKNFPSIEHLPRALSTFNRSKKIQWTKDFTTIETRKKNILELIVIIATILAGLTFLPETARSTLLEILQSAGSAENIQFLIGFFLLLVVGYISTLVETHYLSPIEAKKFAESEAR